MTHDDNDASIRCERWTLSSAVDTGKTGTHGLCPANPRCNSTGRQMTHVQAASRSGHLLANPACAPDKRLALLKNPAALGCYRLCERLRLSSATLTLNQLEAVIVDHGRRRPLSAVCRRNLVRVHVVGIAA